MASEKNLPLHIRSTIVISRRSLGAFAVMAASAYRRYGTNFAAVKDAVKAKGAKKLSVAMTIVSIVALAGYLFLTFRHCSYTLTVVPFIFAAAGIAFIALSGKTKL